MFKVDKFLAVDSLRGLFNKSFQVGFVVSSMGAYNSVMASTRIRCYDVISYLNGRSVRAGLYMEGRSFDIVVFQKAFTKGHINLARRLKEGGSTIVFDINVNYLEREGSAEYYITDEQSANIKAMLEVSDMVIAASSYLKDLYGKYHPNTLLIEESVPDSFFEVKKSHCGEKPPVLLYVGYGAKAKEVLLIEEVLKRLHDETSATLLFICDEDPGIDVIPSRFVKYDQKRLPEQMVEGDIMLAPRDLTSSYNRGHTFTKIAYPMAVGLPVVASPVPSYIDRGAIICRDTDEWYRELRMLIDSPSLRDEVGAKGRECVRENFSMKTIGEKYVKAFGLHVGD